MAIEGLKTNDPALKCRSQEEEMAKTHPFKASLNLNFFAEPELSPCKKMMLRFLRAIYCVF